MKYISTLLILLGFSFFVAAQVNTDSLYNSAIQDSRTGNYETALKKADTLLKILPKRHDIMVFKANIHAWKKDFNTALDYVDKAYKINPDSEELYDTWLNILFWSKKHNKLIEITDLAKQNNYHNTYNLVLKKTIALKALHKYNKAINLIDSNKYLLDSIKIKQLYKELQLLTRTRALSLYYSIDLFDDSKFKPHHFAYIEYASKIGKYTLIPRLNYANRFNKVDMQMEMDLYYMFKNDSYIYANYGLGFQKELFPMHRMGLEYFFPLRKVLGASIGWRYMSSLDYNIHILTGHLSKYIGNFWISYRPFYVLHSQEKTLTSIAEVRYYEKNPINYWGLELLYGNIFDEEHFVLQSADNLLLKRYRIRLKKNIALFKYNELKITAAYSSEEFITDKFRNKIIFEILFKHKF